MIFCQTSKIIAHGAAAPQKVPNQSKKRVIALLALIVSCRSSCISPYRMPLLNGMFLICFRKISPRGDGKKAAADAGKPFSPQSPGGDIGPCSFGVIRLDHSNRPRGGIGRRPGLKIRCSERDVSVRVGPGPPSLAALDLVARSAFLIVRPRTFGAAGGRGRGRTP